MDSLPPRSIWMFLLLVIIVMLRFSQSALSAISEAKLSRLCDEGSKKAEKALKMLDKFTRYDNSLKLLSVFFEILTTVFIADIAISAIAQKGLTSYSILILLLVVLSVAFIIQFFGVFLPQKIASKNAQSILFSLMWIIKLSYVVAMPFERILSALSSLILKPFGYSLVSDEEDDDVTEEEIRFMVDVGSESGAIEEDEKEMIHNIFELNDTPVKDVMTHRTDVEFLWKDEDISKWEETISETNHSVYPVCGETVDDILGFVKTTHFYKLLRTSQNPQDDIQTIIKSPYLVPESIKADDLFRQMQLKKNHFAIVLDEYGGLAGIITMSDLLEEIVGDLDSDSESEEEQDIVKLDENTWRILGLTDIDTVSDALQIDLPIEEYKTFAGLILGELGAIPEDGSTAELEIYGLQIKITKIFEHRIDEAIVCKIDPAAEEDE